MSAFLLRKGSTFVLVRYGHHSHFSGLSSSAPFALSILSSSPISVRNSMSDQTSSCPLVAPEEDLQLMSRPVGGTEYSWCKAVPSGTGITVLALLLSRPPVLSRLRSVLHDLQLSYPIIRSQLLYQPASNNFSFVVSSSPLLQIQSFDLDSTASILHSASDSDRSSVSPFHLILEHELNRNAWSNLDDSAVFFASVYTLSGSHYAVVLRLHTAACDRASAVTLLRELSKKMGGKDGDGTERDLSEKGEVSLSIEDLVPNGKSYKPFWARGKDLVGYSLNSLRLSNLDFKDADSPRFSQVARLQMNSDDTQKLLSGCKSRGIKLCGALAAAGVIATRSSKSIPSYQTEKYAVVTLLDCRSILDPPLPPHHMGFYHSAILNTHDVSADGSLWEVAKRCYTSFADAKNSNKHFTDMSDLNFLMCKAIENPTLTPSASLRTAMISVFEDPVIEVSEPLDCDRGLEDYVGCSSVHGVGPSIAIFDTIRDGQLDCACVYPSPLHSRDQLLSLVDEMKRVLVDGSNLVGSES